MNIKQVIPNMEKTFGILEFAGEDEIVEEWINGKRQQIGRRYNLYSNIQRADNIEVIIPTSAGIKEFEFDEEVKLVNPRIKAEGYWVENRAFTKYMLYADDMVKATA